MTFLCYWHVCSSKRQNVPEIEYRASVAKYYMPVPESTVHKTS
jgi:hypothetical protein